MQALGGLCLLLFIVTVSVVGVRMLLLARRTRYPHELLIGAGMVLVGMFGTRSASHRASGSPSSR